MVGARKSDEIVEDGGDRRVKGAWRTTEELCGVGRTRGQWWRVKVGEGGSESETKIRSAFYRILVFGHAQCVNACPGRWKMT